MTRMIRSMSINFKGHIIVKLMQPAKQHMRSTKYSIPVICILTNNTEIFIVCLLYTSPSPRDS